jgi:hypothetical protein
MYKINQARTFVRDVTIIFPGQDGKDTKGTIKATFNYLTNTEYDEAVALPDVDCFRKVVAGISGIGDANGQELPPDQALEQAANDPCLVSATLAEYVDCMKNKNFRRPRTR